MSEKIRQLEKQLNAARGQAYRLYDIILGINARIEDAQRQNDLNAYLEAKSDLAVATIQHQKCYARIVDLRRELDEAQRTPTDS